MQDVAVGPLRSAAEVEPVGVPAVRVVVVSDVALVAEGLSRLLPRRRFDASAMVADSLESVLARVEGSRAEVVLVDGRMERAAECVRLLSAPPTGRAVVSVGLASASTALEVLSAGALAYVDEVGTEAELADALAAAARREALVPPRLVGELLRRMLLERRWSAQGQPLTRREAEVAELLRAGKSNKEIAGALQIELSTVKNHVHSILVKLGLHGRREIGGWRPNSELNSERARAGRDLDCDLDPEDEYLACRWV